MKRSIVIFVSWGAAAIIAMMLWNYFTEPDIQYAVSSSRSVEQPQYETAPMATDYSPPFMGLSDAVLITLITTVGGIINTALVNRRDKRRSGSDRRKGARRESELT